MPSPARRSTYFHAQGTLLDTVVLSGYDSLIQRIRSGYAGTPVAASESIFAVLAPPLGPDVITPPSFLRAISEGGEVSAPDKAIIDRQISEHLIKIYVYNRQNTTPDVQAQLSYCRRHGIPIASIAETLSPAGLGCQQ